MICDCGCFVLDFIELDEEFVLDFGEVFKAGRQHVLVEVPGRGEVHVVVEARVVVVDRDEQLRLSRRGVVPVFGELGDVLRPAPRRDDDRQVAHATKSSAGKPRTETTARR